MKVHRKSNSRRPVRFDTAEGEKAIRSRQRSLRLASASPKPKRGKIVGKPLTHKQVMEFAAKLKKGDKFRVTFAYAEPDAHMMRSPEEYSVNTKWVGGVVGAWPPDDNPYGLVEIWRFKRIGQNASKSYVVGDIVKTPGVDVGERYLSGKDKNPGAYQHPIKLVKI